MTATIYPNMIHRQILQRLLSGEWRTIIQLGVMAGEGLLERLNKHGWIERRVVGRHPEIRITPAGIEAMKAKIPNNPQTKRTSTRGSA